MVAFSKIPGLDPIYYFSYEYLHAIGLGVTKQITLKVLTDLSPSARDKLDSFLLKIKPTSHMYRTPDMLKNKANWKGSDWLYWLFFYAIPCLKELVDDDCLLLFCTLNRIINTALANSITYSQLLSCREECLLFNERCQKAEFLGVGGMTSNIHSVLHISDCIQKNGPLWATSAFVFESKIAKLKNEINSPKSVPDQIADRIGEYYEYRNRLVIKYVDRFLPCASFCKRLFFRTPKPTFNYITTREGPVLYTDRCQEAGWFSRCAFKDMIYSSKQYKLAKKTDDTAIILKDGRMGLINYFRHEADKIIVNIQHLKVQPQEIADMVSKNIFEVKGIIENIDISFMDIETKLVHVHIPNVSEYLILPPTFSDVK